MIDPATLPNLPRDARLSANYLRNRRVGALVCALLAFLLGVLLLVNRERRASLAEHGAWVQGKVVGRSESRGKSTTYSVRVRYPSGGELYEERYRVPSSTYDASGYGAAFPVFVDRTNPLNSERRAMTKADVDRWTSGWGVAWLAGFGLVALVFVLVHRTAEGEVLMLRDWPASALTVRRVTANPGKAPTITVDGFYLDEKGQRVEVVGLTLMTTVQTDLAMPILYDPGSGKVVPLESVKRAEIAS